MLAPGYQGYRTSVKALKMLFDGNAAGMANIPPREYPFSPFPNHAYLLTRIP